MGTAIATLQYHSHRLQNRQIAGTCLIQRVESHIYDIISGKRKTSETLNKGEMNATPAVITPIDQLRANDMTADVEVEFEVVRLSEVTKSLPNGSRKLFTWHSGAQHQHMIRAQAGLESADAHLGCHTLDDASQRTTL